MVKRTVVVVNFSTIFLTFFFILLVKQFFSLHMCKMIDHYLLYILFLCVLVSCAFRPYLNKLFIEFFFFFLNFLLKTKIQQNRNISPFFFDKPKHKILSHPQNTCPHTVYVPFEPNAAPK